MSEKLLKISLISIYFLTKLSGLNLVYFNKSRNTVTNSNLSVIFLLIATVFIIIMGQSFIINNLGTIGSLYYNNLLSLISLIEAYGYYLLAISTSFLQFCNRKEMCWAINEAIELNNLLYKSYGSCNKKMKKLCIFIIKKFLIFMVLCVLLTLYNFVGLPDETITISYIAGNVCLMFIVFMNTSLINMFVTSVCFSLYFLTILNRKLKSIVDNIVRSNHFDENSTNELCNEINELAIHYQRVVSLTKFINKITNIQILVSMCSSFINIISQIFFMYVYSLACVTTKDSIISTGSFYISGVVYIMFNAIEMFAVSNISYRVMKKIQKTGVILSTVMRTDLDDKLDESVSI